MQNIFEYFHLLIFSGYIQVAVNLNVKLYVVQMW